MKAALAQVRRMSWATTGILALGRDVHAELASVNERVTFEALRMAVDLLRIVAKPPPIEWIDSTMQKRQYRPDALAWPYNGPPTFLEIKPAGMLDWQHVLRRKYEAIGSYLQVEGRYRFGLVEWRSDSVFARNVSRLSRYWAVEPEGIATDAFSRIGRRTTTLGQLLDRVDVAQWNKVYAAIANQELAVDLEKAPLSRASHLWLPTPERPALRLADLVNTWWA
ncbi:hypothetical protein LJR084_007484 [Variovorax sp. LjRoot84]|uniref:hypothetical protein n=1 Tax=Variovorax sp. LjRoot84 TaxID=3342340 RepID=UPI003ECC8D67